MEVAATLRHLLDIFSDRCIDFPWLTGRMSTAATRMGGGVFNGGGGTFSTSDDGFIFSCGTRELRPAARDGTAPDEMVMKRRRAQLSQDELRSLLMDAGREIIREEGLSAGAELLTFKRVRDRVEESTGIHIGNGSIIGRIWDSLFDFQTAVLAEIASDSSTVEIEQTLDGLAPTLLTADPSSVDSRWSTVREVCRLGAAANMEALSQSTDWSLWIGVWAATPVGSAPVRQRRIEAALEHSYLAVTERMERIYQATLRIVGFQVRPGVTVRQFTIAVSALTEGCVLRNRVDAEEMNGIMRSTGPAGEGQEWTLFGIALEALTEKFFEPDPTWQPPGLTCNVRSDASEI